MINEETRRKLREINLGEAIKGLEVQQVNILVCGNHYSGNMETDIPVVGNRLNSAWLIGVCIDVICPACILR